jgi:hypothetical protein
MALYLDRPFLLCRRHRCCLLSLQFLQLHFIVVATAQYLVRRANSKFTAHRNANNTTLSLTLKNNSQEEEQHAAPQPAEEPEEHPALEEDHPTFFNFIPTIAQGCRLHLLPFWWLVCRLWGWLFCFIFGASSGELSY